VKRPEETQNGCQGGRLREAPSAFQKVNSYKSSRFEIIDTFTLEGKERLLHEYGLCSLYEKASSVVSGRPWRVGKFTLLSPYYHAVRHGFGTQARGDR